MCVVFSLLSDDEGWKGQQRDGSSVQVQWSPSSQEISLVSDDYFPMYFVAPGTAADSFFKLDTNRFIHRSIHTRNMVS